jgi:hypothetical protein
VNIGILTSTNPQLRQQLDADGTPNATTQTGDSEAVTQVAVAKPRLTVNVAPSVRFPSLRAALDARIAADVSSGQLSPGDAVTVGKALDAIDSRSRQALAANAAANVARNYLATIDRGTLIDRFA